MSYEVNRVHKVEENLCREICEYVYAHVTEYFDVDTIEELTEEQIEEVEAYRSCRLGEYSVLQVGYSDVINLWESQEGAPIA